MSLSQKVFVKYPAFLIFKIKIYLTWKAYIVLLITKKVIILTKYLDYTNVFSEESTIELSKYYHINKYLIDLELDK